MTTVDAPSEKLKKEKLKVKVKKWRINISCGEDQKEIHRRTCIDPIYLHSCRKYDYMYSVTNYCYSN